MGPAQDSCRLSPALPRVIYSIVEILMLSGGRSVSLINMSMYQPTREVYGHIQAEEPVHQPCWNRSSSSEKCTDQCVWAVLDTYARRHRMPHVQL